MAPGLAQDPEQVGRNMLMMFNAAPERRAFIIPPMAKGTNWRMLLDTAAVSPEDIYPDANGPSLPLSGKIMLPDRSLRCYVEHLDAKLN